MARVTLAHLDPAFVRRHLPDLAAADVVIASERELQTWGEHYLDCTGFRRLTAAQSAMDGTPIGWYGHLAQAPGNPLLPDLFIMEGLNKVPPLLVEFKFDAGRGVNYQAGQREMIARGVWIEVRTSSAFVDAVRGWLGSIYLGSPTCSG